MYNVDYELETNYDDEPDCLPEGERRNRTSEPEMFAIKHQRHRHQLLKLLERQDYDAMLDMSQNLPKQLRTLLQHLSARNNLQPRVAAKEAAVASMVGTAASSKQTISDHCLAS